MHWISGFVRGISKKDWREDSESVRRRYLLCEGICVR